MPTAHDVLSTWDDKAGEWFHVCQACWISTWGPLLPTIPCSSDIPECDHDWTLRPESDTWFCEMCGAER